MKTIRNKVSVLAVVLAVCGACSDDGGVGVGAQIVTGNGIGGEENRAAAGATWVTFASEGDIAITQGVPEQCVVRAETNLLPHLLTDVQGGELNIHTEPNFDLVPTKPIEFVITLPNIERVDFAGVGEMNLADVVADDLTLTSTGVGDFHCIDLTATNLTVVVGGIVDLDCAGTVTNQTVIVDTSLGDYDAPMLSSENADVTIEHGGSATVNVSNSLEATVNGSGKVYYYDSSPPGTELIVNCQPATGCSKQD
jgi:hypothetical protein